jgi:hypothetical protein
MSLLRLNLMHATASVPGTTLVVTRGPRAAGTMILAAREWRGNGRKAN